MDSEKELVIFRIIQESFNNILKHAQAKKICLILSYHTSFLQIKVIDNGTGFLVTDCNVNGNTRSGLSNMQTRARLFGGHVELESTLGRGTTILVTVPYN